MPKKTFRYRLYPTAAQRDVLDGQLHLCCELYNAALQERRDAWRMARVSMKFAGQSAQLPAIKTDRPDVAAVYAQVLQRREPCPMRGLRSRRLQACGVVTCFSPA